MLCQMQHVVARHRQTTVLNVTAQCKASVIVTLHVIVN